MCFFSVGCLNGVRRVCAQMVATFNIETFLKFDLTLPLFQNLFLTLIWAKSNSIQEIAKIFDASPEYTNKTTFTVCVFFVCFFCFFFFVFFFFLFFFCPLYVSNVQKLLFNEHLTRFLPPDNGKFL